MPVLRVSYKKIAKEKPLNPKAKELLNINMQSPMKISSDRCTT